MSNFKILRTGEVAAYAGLSKTAIHELRGQGLFPPAINLWGGRTVGYFETEIDAVMIARANDASDSDIKDLVKKLVEMRKFRLEEMLQDLCA